MKTKAIVFEDLEKVAVREVELPDMGPADVLVETELSGVSVGTERWALIGKRSEITLPSVPGYMGLGRIVEAGRQACTWGYEPGRRLSFLSSKFAGEMDGRSWMGAHVARAVVAVSPDAESGDWFTHALVPEDCDPADVSLTGLCAVAMRGIEEAVVPAGAKVLVCGLGILGQYAVQVCRLKGALVAAAEVVDARLQLARKVGAEWTINPRAENLADRAAEIAPGGFDVIIDTSSIPEVVRSLVPLVKLRGKFIFQGWYPPLSELDLNALQARMARCFFPCGHSGAAVAASMRWAAEGRIDTRSLITHTARPDDAPKIYEMILAGSEDFLGVVFDWRL